MVNSTSIAESEYLFEEKAMQLMQNFFEINNTSLLKVGMLGYVTSMFSHGMRDGTFHRDALFNEQFLIAASQNSTLYNWAKTVGHNISLATPSHYDIGFKISLVELNRVATVDTNNNNILNFTIDRSTIFDLGGYKWLLPYSVAIRLSKSSTGTMSVTASYDFDDYNYKDKSITTPYLKVIITTINGVDYAVISLRLFQLVKKDWIYTISTTSTYGYYTFIGDDVLRLYFSAKSTFFHPAFNSKVKVETFTTSAEEGNFNYSGNISIKSSEFDNIAHEILAISTSSTGGASIKSFTDTKIALMQKLRTRDNYTTTYDLETYFTQVKKSELNTNSDFQIVKLRDDIIRRQFSCFVLQRNSKGDLVPTNTVNMSFSLAELSNIGYSIKPGTLVLYDRVQGTYRLLDDSELPEIYLKATDSFLYCVPYLINIDFKEFPKATTYLTNYNVSNSLSYYSYNTANPYEIIMNYMNVSRNPMIDLDSFKISAYISTTTVDISRVKVRAVLLQNNVAAGYFDLSKVANSTEFTANIYTDDTFDSDGYYIIKNTVKDIKTNTVISNFKLDGTYTVRLGVFINGTNVSKDITNYPLYGTMNDLTDYGIICEFEAEDPLTFADDLSDIMYCQTIMNSDLGTVSINSIPLVGALFYLNQYQNEEVMNDIYKYINIVRNVTNSLENNTIIDVKFFNTTGVSKYFDIDTTDIKLKLDIALNTTANSAIDYELKNAIVSFIENINSLSEKRFSLSNLIKTLETNYTYIKYIRFTSINGTNIQNIQQTEYVNYKTEDLPYDYVPEYLCVRKKVPDNISESDFSYDIEINYI